MIGLFFIQRLSKTVSGIDVSEYTMNARDARGDGREGYAGERACERENDDDSRGARRERA